MADRYYVDAPISLAHTRLTGAEAHHLAHVMRAKPGDVVTLFDGSGAEFSATIEKVGRAEIELAVTARHEVDRELPIAITLGVALPKGDRQRWLVEKAVELGVARLVPLVTERSGERPSQPGERLLRAVIEASKQCGRNRLMQIGDSERFDAFLTSVPPDAARWIAHPGGESVAAALDAAYTPRPRHLVLAVGPEGGFSGAEVEQAASAGWRVVALGRRVLRVETAALAIVAAAATRFETA